MGAGNVVGSPTFDTGKFGSALIAITDADYISAAVSSFAALQTGTFVWRAWLRTSGTNIQVAFYYGHTGDVGQALWFGANAGNFVAVVPGFGNNGIVDSAIKINDGAWHFCEVAVSAGLLSIYVDGVRGVQVSGTYTPDSSAAYAYIGRFFSGGFAWPGGIDEVSIWSTSQSGASSTVPSAAYAGTETGLQALYRLDGDASAVGAAVLQPTVASLPQPNVFFPPQGWDTSNSGHAITVASGNYLKASFTNSVSGVFSLVINVAQFGSIADASRPSLTYVIDHGTPGQIALIAANTPGGVVALGGSLAAGTHTIQVWLRSSDPYQNRWNLSTANLSLDITGFEMSNGGTLVFNPITRLPNMALFYGDSMTESEGTEARASANFRDNSDATHGYPLLVAAQINAEYAVAGFGGQGWTTSAADGQTPGFVSTYGLLYAGKTRSFSGLTHVFINQGTNGNTIGGAGTMATLLASLRTALKSAASSASVSVIVPFSGSARSAILADFATYQGGSYSTSAEGAGTYYRGTADALTVALDTNSILGWDAGPNSIYPTYSYDTTHLTTLGNSIVGALLSRLHTAAFATAPAQRSYTFS